MGCMLGWSCMSMHSAQQHLPAWHTPMQPQQQAQGACLHSRRAAGRARCSCPSCAPAPGRTRWRAPQTCGWAGGEGSRCQHAVMLGVVESAATLPGGVLSSPVCSAAYPTRRLLTGPGPAGPAQRCCPQCSPCRRHGRRDATQLGAHEPSAGMPYWTTPLLSHPYTLVLSQACRPYAHTRPTPLQRRTAHTAAAAAARRPPR